MTTTTLPDGMRTYVLVWIGQLVSLLGSGLTNFSLGVWVFQRTGSATQYTLIGFCAAMAGVVALPLAGSLTDRYDRRRLMLLSNVAAGTVKLCVIVLLLAGRLGTWHVYVAAGCIASSSVLLNLAFGTATTLLVPKSGYGRANGMTQAAQAAGQVVAPLLAGALLSVISVGGILLLDLLSYLFAIGSLLLVRFPPQGRPETDAEGKRQGILRDFTLGWTYIRSRRGLLALLLFFAALNFASGTVTILLGPMVLSFTSAKVLGIIMSLSGAGLLTGSVVMSAWGGSRNRVKGVLVCGGLWGGFSALAGLSASPILIGSSAFCMFLLTPIANGCNQAIWQSKVQVELQGRVFAVRRMIGLSTLPLAFLVAGPLADRVFEPLAVAGALGGSNLSFAGPGRGMGFMFVLAGLLVLAAQVWGFFYPPLRHLEADLPDVIHDVTFVPGCKTGDA